MDFDFRFLIVVLSLPHRRALLVLAVLSAPRCAST